MDLNRSNRPARTRMPGGVGGVGPRGLPLSRFWRTRKIAGTETERAECIRSPSQGNADSPLILESGARRIGRRQLCCGERVQQSALLYFFLPAPI
jgi:hypothetical protein